MDSKQRPRSGRIQRLKPYHYLQSQPYWRRTFGKDVWQAGLTITLSSRLRPLSWRPLLRRSYKGKQSKRLGEDKFWLIAPNIRHVKCHIVSVWVVEGVTKKDGTEVMLPVLPLMQGH